MTLRELLEAGLIMDDDVICIHRPMYGTPDEIRKGNWFHDQILDVMEEKIDRLRYACGEWDVHLQFKED